MSYLYIIAAILIWSTQGIIIKTSGVSTQLLVYYSAVFALVVQSAVLLVPSWRRERPDMRQSSRIIILSIVILINSYTFLLAFAKTSISDAVFSHYTAPIFVAVLAPVFLKERVRITTVIAIALSTFGLWLMLGEIKLSDYIGIFLSREGVLSPRAEGIAFGVISGMAYAAIIILGRIFMQRLNPFVVVLYQNAFIVLLMTPFTIHLPLPVESWLVFAIIGIFYATIAPCLYYVGLKRVEAGKAATLGYLEPLGAILFSMIFLHEYPDALSLAGGVLILMSGYLVMRKG